MQPIPFPGTPPSERERATVAAQLGRDPRGEVALAARCPYGLPAVVRTFPRLADGTPFPTLYYLTCPVAVRAIGRLEAEGMMTALNDRLAVDDDLASAYAAAHDRYRAQRDALEPVDDPATAGGMPDRVKCLHALYAHEVADANPIGALVRERIEPIDCPGPCVEGSGERVPDHPGFKGRKKRHR